MSLLPQQMLPQTEPLGSSLPDGRILISKNWWLLLYNFYINSVGVQGLTGDQALLFSGTDIDAFGTDNDQKDIENLDVLIGQDLLPSSNRDIENMEVSVEPENIPPNQQVDSNASPAFVAVKVGTALKTSPASGFVESDGNLFYATDQNLLRLAIQRTLFTQTASVSVSNTVTETTLLGSGVGTITLPANYGIAGKTLLIEGFGYHSATGNPTIRIRFYKGSTVLLDTTAVTSGNSTNNLIQIRGAICWRSTTSVFSQGFYQESGGGSNNFEMLNTSATTVSASSEALNLTVQWGTANVGNSVTLTNLTIRECN